VSIPRRPDIGAIQEKWRQGLQIGRLRLRCVEFVDHAVRQRAFGTLSPGQAGEVAMDGPGRALQCHASQVVAPPSECVPDHVRGKGIDSDYFVWIR